MTLPPEWAASALEFRERRWLEYGAIRQTRAFRRERARLAAAIDEPHADACACWGCIGRLHMDVLHWHLMRVDALQWRRKRL